MTINQPKKTFTPRKPGAERRQEIARIAGDLFAAEGFQVSTRSISAALGITQAALYKHFASKEALIEEVFRQRFLDDKESDFQTLLTGSAGPLGVRLSVAYIEFFSQISSTSMRLFQRASYDGLEIAKRYSPHLDSRILAPVIGEVRHELALPTLEVVQILPEERDLALMLHSTVVFLAIRKYVYHIDFSGQEPEKIRLHVDTWLAGVREVIPPFHGK